MSAAPLPRKPALAVWVWTMWGLKLADDPGELSARADVAERIYGRAELGQVDVICALGVGALGHRLLAFCDRAVNQERLEALGVHSAPAEHRGLMGRSPQIEPRDDAQDADALGQPEDSSSGFEGLAGRVVACTSAACSRICGECHAGDSSSQSAPRPTAT